MKILIMIQVTLLLEWEYVGVYMAFWRGYAIDVWKILFSKLQTECTVNSLSAMHLNFPKGSYFDDDFRSLFPWRHTWKYKMYEFGISVPLKAITWGVFFRMIRDLSQGLKHR